MPKIHQFRVEQILSTTMDDAWDFFSDPSKLDEITPPEVGFETISGADEKMFAGQIIVHRIKILPLVRVRWVTEITHVEPGKMFVDEQRFGPYKFWHHRHEFKATDDDQVRMTDTVHYAVGMWVAGEIANKIFVRRQLENIFGHRREVLAEYFSDKQK